jgi:hypothetical protein
LLFVEVVSSTLPVIGDVDADGGLPLQEGWVIDHATESLQPLFATQRGYVFNFLPGNHHILVEQPCYGENLGGGLHLVDIDERTLVTVAEVYHGLCEFAFPRLPSPNGQYLIHSGGTIINVDGETQGEICKEEEFPRSWTWSGDSQRVYVACSEGEHDLVWQFDVETGMKVLVNEGIKPSIGMKAREMAVSPDEGWLAFVWGKTALFPEDERGVWLLKLARHSSSRLLDEFAIRPSDLGKSLYY